MAQQWGEENIAGTTHGDNLILRFTMHTVRALETHGDNLILGTVVVFTRSTVDL